MCGIAGFWGRPGPSAASLAETAAAMALPLRHRGPDDAGTWVDAENGVALGFRRLAIIDLSEKGHQPMRSRSGQYTVVFNGEIYNHPELAEELTARGHVFDGHSDTEIALAAFEEWGVDEALPRFVGMFAMGIWDARHRALRLVRDRLGIKPLFVWQRDGNVAFASELKAIAALPGFRRDLDPDALAAYFRYLYVPAPLSIYRDVGKLLPGHVLTLTSPAGDVSSSRPFWSVEEVARRERTVGFEGDDRDAVDALDTTLLEAVRLRLRADVPVGAFLSGGVDSSTVVALMQEVSPRPVRTFTVGFDAEEHDESANAAAVARHLGTDHQEMRLTGGDALDLVPSLPDMFDEPLADPSQLPTYLLCAAARQQVTVAVSGDGGDELFAGYNRYGFGSRIIPRASRLPAAPRQLVAAGLTSVRPGTWDRLQGGAAALFRVPEHRLAGEKAHKLGHLLRQTTAPAMYRSLVSAWQRPPVEGRDGVDERTAAILSDPSMSILERMMLSDQLAYLPDDLLAKVDRASMAVSLEVRVPILDHRVVELSWRLPESTKLRDGEGKWVLRQVLERRVPRELVDRPKVGFTVPLGDWLRGPLRGWAEERLRPERLRQVPGLDAERIHAMWGRFSSGRSADHLGLWTVLAFEAWRERWLA